MSTALRYFEQCVELCKKAGLLRTLRDQLRKGGFGALLVGIDAALAAA